MQADSFAEYMQCAGENSIGALAPDLVRTSTLITCVNARLSGSLGEYLVQRPGEADVTGRDFLQARLIVQVLERHEAEVQSCASRARSLKSIAPNREQVRFKDFEHDLDRFVRTIIQALQERHPSD